MELSGGLGNCYKCIEELMPNWKENIVVAGTSRERILSLFNAINETKQKPAFSPGIIKEITGLNERTIRHWLKKLTLEGTVKKVNLISCQHHPVDLRTTFYTII